ncbi:MAG: hypothetical protein LBG89_03855 [Rickettsiales bacterium]|jgi:hypothetical protein|nr:hypothetical protein [Rickettsiales bacterium]
MKKILFGFIGAIVSFSAVHAAGTYYNYGANSYGNYANSQASGVQNRAGQQNRMSQQFGAGGGYSQYSPQGQQQYLPQNQQASRFGGQQAQQQQQNNNGGQIFGNGFTLTAHAGYDNSDFGFSMNETQSEINFNNMTWMKFGGTAGYEFAVGGVKLEVKGGFEIGSQGESGSITDDDMSQGGVFVGYAGFNQTPSAPTISLYSPAVNGNQPVYFGVSQLIFGVGEQGQGTSLGAFASIGMGDGFQIGESVKIKPSVGYRHEQFKAIGQNMMTMAVQALIVDDREIGLLKDVATNCNGCQIVLTIDGETYFFGGWVEGFDDYGEPFFLTLSEAAYLEGVTHEYNVSWSGPFLATDIEMKTAQNSGFNLRLELGFPGYTAEADQPYRADWAHPTSIKDSAPIFSGLHYGLNLKYTAGLTDNIAVNLGWNWDYYKVDGADAETFYAPGSFGYQEFGKSSKLAKEVNARYRTSGVRAGLTAKF